MKHVWRRLSLPASLVGALVALCLLSAVDGARAQTAAPAASATPPVTGTLKVGVYVSPPFVMKQGDGYAGMAIDLWQSLADQLGLTYEYTPVATIRDLVNATEAGDIDVAVTNLTITQGRAERVDFTQPWFDAGLRVMINDASGAGFWEVVGGLQESGFLKAYAWLIAVIFAATLVLTLFDRRFDRNFPSGWREGLAESFYTVMSVATSGRPPSRKNLFGWLGRVWQALWLVCGIAVFAYITSSITSVMTTLQLSNQIAGVDDLHGRTVGVSAGGTSEDFARDFGLESRAYDGIDAQVAGLTRREVAAIIGDAPVLEYYVHTHPDVPLDVVGRVFEPDKYGFALPRGSALTRPLTVTLLGAHESGLIEELDAKYFGSED
jgi:ABC-type amino acid transport substrate-binding protein